MLMISSLFLSFCALSANPYSIIAGLCFSTAVSALSMFKYFEFTCLGSVLSSDSLSITLITLSAWIVMLLTMASHKAMKTAQSSLFMQWNMILLLFLTLIFLSSNTLMFYVFFEASLVPIFMLILGWGAQPERASAGVFALIYTVSASLPFLVVLLNWVSQSSTAVLSMLNPIHLSFNSSMISFFVIIPFAVKLPMYITHLWLPKAHVEAPVAGSMILAGVLLKLGGYGLLRFSVKMSKYLMKFNKIWISWALVGGAVIGILCLSQTDMKILIALSSVTHMALVVSSVLALSTWGLFSAMFIMLGHGFCSSAMFAKANMIYERLGSRNILVSKGVGMTIPGLLLWWFMTMASNMSAPPSMSLLGEMAAFTTFMTWSYSSTLVLMALNFLPAAYSLYLYAEVALGKAPSSVSPVSPLYFREHLVSLLHLLPLFLLTFKMSIIF
uniref:NADH-ubiquinone oxidoreductase chain 4 n=1 Tax=Orthione mesoamericana TaxID=2480053 RepID=A0A8K1Y3J2_9CRUS|nr:NADH dehydrogenase subunit 4 [Orthione mesoamericana]